ncbi:hypothetical protein SAMN05421644_10230 [Allochromatium warmingii]|uniref:AAA domain-containing protein n=1 Tax=Allochromatium warmingii TaxID=61595 RepID=A0A1H3B4Y0_ALLWA|nr:hypothetical protein [Allochromatium warmingii]SDX36681.1 hypothetical protein SAMN05421644_10230 [Allochromatium warmingii]
MPSLREPLTTYGFESNDEYAFAVRCWLDGPTAGVRALNLAGDGQRRKTAFAHALAQALGFTQILYHDFTDQHPPLPDVILPPSQDELGRTEPPIEPLDRIVSEACAQSEGDLTVLILDQLHTADFRQHLRLHRLLTECVWEVRGGSYVANPKRLHLMLLSDEPLYHALRQESFRLWIGRQSERQQPYQPADFGLGPEAQPLFTALPPLFDVLGVVPTHHELTRLLSDFRLQVCTLEQLRLSLYGRLEGVEHAALRDPLHQGALAQVWEAVQSWLITEHIEVAEVPNETNSAHER